MPEVEICPYCDLPLDRQNEKYVLINKGTYAEQAVHVQCYLDYKNREKEN